MPERLFPARGFMIGILLSSLLWAAIIGFFVSI